MKENFKNESEEHFKYDFSEVNNIYSSKNEKIKDAVKKELEKLNEKGLRGITLDKIKAMVSPILSNQEKIK